MSGKQFTPYELDRLREWWELGLTARLIGLRLDRSRGSIIGKAHRLDLTARPSPIIRGDDPAKRTGHVKRINAPPTMRGLPHPRPAPTLAVRPVVKAPPPRPPPERPYGRIVNCCWPIGNARPQQFCGDTSEPGKPYCAEHAKLAYVPKRVLEQTGD